MGELVMVDMGISNLASVAEAFRRIGAGVRVTGDPADVARARALILPGVGAFGDGMSALRAKRLDEAVKAHVLERRRPLMGICLGMQLLTEGSHEHGWHEGLGLIPGRCVRLAPDDPGLRVPNMGWCDVEVRRPTAFFEQVVDGESFYFAHSFHVRCDKNDVAASFRYGGEVVAALSRDGVCGVQFHPERSQDAGLRVLAGFVAAAA